MKLFDVHLRPNGILTHLKTPKSVTNAVNQRCFWVQN